MAYKLVKDGRAWDYSDLLADVENWRDKVLREEPEARVKIVEVSHTTMMKWKQG